MLYLTNFRDASEKITIEMFGGKLHVSAAKAPFMRTYEQQGVDLCGFSASRLLSL
jgi:hypothetical protein